MRHHFSVIKGALNGILNAQILSGLLEHRLLKTMPSSDQVATYRDNPVFITMIRTSITSIALFFEELVIDYRNQVRVLCQPDHHLHSFSHNYPLLHNLPRSSSVLQWRADGDRIVGVERHLVTTTAFW